MNGSTSSRSIAQSTMEDVKLRMPLFHGVGNEDPKQHLFSSCLDIQEGLRQGDEDFTIGSHL